MDTMGIHLEQCLWDMYQNFLVNSKNSYFQQYNFQFQTNTEYQEDLLFQIIKTIV